MTLDRWTVVLEGASEPPTFSELHAGVAWWMFPRRDDPQHRAGTQHYSVGPAERSGEWTLFEVRTIGGEAEQRLTNGFWSQRSKGFRTHRRTLRKCGLIHKASATWEDLAAQAEPVDAILIDLQSPTTWNHQGRTVVAPHPAQIIGSLRQRWRELAPAAAQPARLSRPPDVEIADAQLSLVSTGTRHDRHAAIGTMLLDLRAHDEPDRRVLDHLFSAVPFFGLGAQVAHGCGSADITRLVAC